MTRKLRVVVELDLRDDGTYGWSTQHAPGSDGWRNGRDRVAGVIDNPGRALGAAHAAVQAAVITWLDGEDPRPAAGLRTRLAAWRYRHLTDDDVAGLHETWVGMRDEARDFHSRFGTRRSARLVRRAERVSRRIRDAARIRGTDLAG